MIALIQVEKVEQRSGFETRRFMREQGLGNPIRALWYMTQVINCWHVMPLVVHQHAEDQSVR